MAPSINIPLDAISSRFNMGAVTDSIRSQSIGSRFANLRPVGEFFDIKRLSKPANFGEVQSRINYNLSYFSSNYMVIGVMLAIYGLISNMWLLFDMIFVGCSLFIIKKLDGRDLELGFTRLTTAQLYTGTLIIGIPVFIFSGPISLMLWLIGAVGVCTFGHASFMDKPIDQAFSEEAV